MIVNVTALLAPFVPLTVTFTGPATAAAATEKVAVICVALTTLTFDTVRSGDPDVTVAPAGKLKPLIVTGADEASPPLDGLIPVMYGVEASTVLEAPALPEYVAVNDTADGVAGSDVVIGNGALDEPAGMKTVEETEATPGFELSRLTVTPPCGAGPVRKTLPLTLVPPWR